MESCHHVGRCGRSRRQQERGGAWSRQEPRSRSSSKARGTLHPLVLAMVMLPWAAEGAATQVVAKVDRDRGEGMGVPLMGGDHWVAAGTCRGNVGWQWSGSWARLWRDTWAGSRVQWVACGMGAVRGTLVRVHVCHVARGPHVRGW